VVAGNRVFTVSAEGILQAVDRDTGNRLWLVDTQEAFDIPRSFFGAASSPLLVEDRALLNVGGRDGSGVVAFDAATGEISWRTSDHGASYSSPRLVSLGGAPRAVFFTRTGLLILEPESGAIVSQFRWRARINASVNATTPTVVGDRVFLSSSYGTGAVFLDLGGGEPREIWRSDRSLTNHYATSVHHEGFLYGFHGRQESGPSLRCVRLDTGEVLWSEDRFGAGSLLLVEDHLLILRESGEIVSAPASPEGFEPVARAQILEGETRAYPALAGGIFVARDSEKLVAVDLRRESATVD
jgi:outer membrane protein assembly factor BamB